MHVVTLCGSLRARSSNRAMLRAWARVAPAGVRVGHYEGVGALPHFNPDLDGESDGAEAGEVAEREAGPHPEVVALRRAIAKADAVVISTPEYAHALPGAFKNALDWLVSDPAFAGKPVAILHADRGGSRWAYDSLREVLRTMAARIVEPACALLPLGSNVQDETALLARPEIREALERSAGALVGVVRG